MTDQFLKRRDKVRKTLSKNNADAVLITNPANVRYLTNFTGSGSLVIRHDTDIVLTDPRFTLQVSEECSCKEVFVNPRSVAKSDTLAQCLKKSSGTICIEAASVTLAERERLFANLPGWNVIPVSNVVENLRAVKDKTEIASIRAAVQSAYYGWLLLQRYMSFTPQADEIDICNILDYGVRTFGAEDRSFATIVAAGSRAALPHAVPTHQKYAGQSHLLIDWGGVVNGYCSDLTRVFIFDHKDKQLRKVYDTVLKANEAAIEAIQPGKTCEEIDRVASKILLKSRLIKETAHALGHSIGLEIHEDPRFSAGDKTVLQPGMVITVEPGIYIPEWGGVRIEDDVLVTKTGCKVLSDYVPKQFKDVCL
jgi:Xaa-Pro aminopeptidase